MMKLIVKLIHSQSRLDFPLQKNMCVLCNIDDARDQLGCVVNERKKVEKNEEE